MGVSLAIPFRAASQGSSINTFSPYTFSGVGEISTPGTSFIRSMGGAGIAYRSPWMINYMNPASNSAATPKSFLLNFGMEGSSYYLKSAEKKSSHNTFNVRDVAIRFPLMKGLGMGVSVTPFSNVGYRVQSVDYPENVDFNQVKNTYSGEGGISQVKVGVGAMLFKNFSVGVDMVYYLGSINRYFNTVITPNNTTGPYNPVTASQSENISKIFANFGLQYDVIANDKSLMTLGATYQLGGSLNSKINRYIPSNDLFQDIVTDTTYRSGYSLPAIVSLGIYYHREKWSLGADYTFQKWHGINNQDETDKIKYQNTSSFKLGAQYTPNRRDVRRFYNRWTYRAGLRYSGYNMEFDGHQLTDKAVTIGLGIPVKMSGMSNINLGMEVGSMGTTNYGLIKQRYVKFSIGLSLFGEDYWFVKQKYD